MLELLEQLKNLGVVVDIKRLEPKSYRDGESYLMYRISCKHETKNRTHHFVEGDDINLGLKKAIEYYKSEKSKFIRDIL